MGQFHVNHYNKYGKLKGKYVIKNGVTIEGKNFFLDVTFHGVTRAATWYIGLIDDAGYVSELAGDTLASKGWNEFTSYTGSRLAWNESAAASQSITSSTTTDFAITVNGLLRGIFVASVASGTAGKLWASGDFSSPVSVDAGDVLKINYTVNA